MTRQWTQEQKDAASARAKARHAAKSELKKESIMPVETVKAPHRLAGKYDMDGTIVAPNGVTYTFKAAVLEKDAKAPATMHGFKACLLRIAVNDAACEELMAACAKAELAED